MGVDGAEATEAATEVAAAGGPLSDFSALPFFRATAASLVEAYIYGSAPLSTNE